MPQTTEAGAATMTGAPILLGLQLTLLDLLLQPIGPWWLRWAILGLAVGGLLWRRALTHPSLWLALATLTGIRVMADWPLSDNHAYLLSYWCLACGLANLSEEAQRYLARNARWMIGLVFAFALLWKLLPGSDYTSGVFFRVTMLTDPRFENLAMLAGGLSIEQFEMLQMHVTTHADGGLAAGFVAPPEPQRFTLLAQVAAWWNIISNAALALAFLWPEQRGLSRYRNELLLLFCTVTYAIATVAGFGWLLIAMAVSQTQPAENRLRMAYAAAFLLILIYREVPWADAILGPLAG